MLSAEEASALEQCYLFLRKVEHYLQQFNDEQTQTLPETQIDQNRLAYLLEQPDFPACVNEIDACMLDIHTQFQMLIGDTQQEEENQDCQDARDLWQLALDEEEASTLLSAHIEASLVSEFYLTLEKFKQSVAKKPLGQKGRDALNIVVPNLIARTFTNKPDKAVLTLARSLQVISAILGRTTYLQLLNENAGALEQLVKLCQVSPWISEQLSRFPILLDELLNPYSLYNPTPLNSLAYSLSGVGL